MDNQRIGILGSGMVSRTMANDLAKKFNVTVFDINEHNLALAKEKDATITTIKADLSNYNNYSTWLADFDLVITAVPGFMGYKTLEAVINAGKNVADISFFEEDVMMLNDLAKQKQVTVITDIGVAPGMSNLIAGYYSTQMSIENFEFYVGGLPKNPQPPFYYKAPFSPIDVIEEYTRPARFKENGTIVTYPPLSGRRQMEFSPLGTLEAFNTDGLRSLLYTLNIPNMKEQTLRYNGHIELVSQLINAGFLSDKKLSSGITYNQVTCEMLFNNWQYQPNEPDVTIMQVICSNASKKVVYSMYDEFDETNGQSSMSRTTGFTCTAAANLILSNQFQKKGVFPPELLGQNHDCFEFIIDYLSQRNVNWIKEEYALS
jgi:lysine 6-dehydrogenase